MPIIRASILYINVWVSGANRKRSWSKDVLFRSLLQDLFIIAPPTHTCYIPNWSANDEKYFISLTSCIKTNLSVLKSGTNFSSKNLCLCVKMNFKIAFGHIFLRFWLFLIILVTRRFYLFRAIIWYKNFMLNAGNSER